MQRRKANHVKAELVTHLTDYQMFSLFEVKYGLDVTDVFFETTNKIPIARVGWKQ